MVDTFVQANNLRKSGADAMRILRFLPGPRSLPWASLLVPLLFFAPSAHATTFLYTFTTTQLLSALSGDSHGEDESAYFAIFFKPTSLGAYGTGYTYGAEYSPKPGGTGDDWQATIDSSNPFSTSAPDLEFGKLSAAGLVTVVATNNAWSSAGPPSMQNYTFAGDGGTSSVQWGTTPGKIDSQMSLSAVFAFTLNMASNPGPVTFSGQVSELTFCNVTEFTNTTFTLTLTGTLAAPEPDTIVLLGLGAALMVVGGVCQKAKKTAAG
jgi:hypothetical protein